METTAKITSKGQITVPKVVREALGVGAGDRLRFLVEDGGVLVKAVPRPADFVGMLADGSNSAVRHVRELAAHYSGQDLVKEIKSFERQGVTRYLARKHVPRKR